MATFTSIFGSASVDVFLTALSKLIAHGNLIEVSRELADLDLDRGSAVDALGRWVDASWELLTRYPVLLTPAMVGPGPGDELELHEPITSGLIRLIERGRRRREFDQTMPTTWYLAAIIGLGHAASQEVIAGRMTPAKAGTAFRKSAIRVCRVQQ